MERNFKVRIRFPSGAEFEAEGDPEFIHREKMAFLTEISAAPKEAGGPPNTGGCGYFQPLMKTQGGLYTLKGKYETLEGAECAIMLIGANQSGENGISAINLSKAMKISGYKTKRLDRLLMPEIRNGTIISSGSKRNRTYQLSPKGIKKACLLAQKIDNSLRE